MKDAVVQLFSSRKFLVMLVGQLAIWAPAYFGHMNPELAAELGTALAIAWGATHAHEEAAKIKANGPVDPPPDGAP